MLFITCKWISVLLPLYHCIVCKSFCIGGSNLVIFVYGVYILAIFIGGGGQIVKKISIWGLKNAILLSM